MKRHHVTAVTAAITVALATSAAFAQDRDGPDFSPMKPGGYDELRSQPSPEPAPFTPSHDTYSPATPPQNSMLDAYEASALPPAGAAAVPYESRSRPRVAVAPPRQSTIGNGLFERRGPNDFGA
jgi:hypothetical protein